jgi:TonB family protein
MNAPVADTHSPPESSWGFNKTIFVILFVFAAHLAFVFLFGQKKTPAPRIATNVPVFQLADNASELVRLTDPTLFAFPHAEDFASTAAATPAVTEPSFAWTEPPPFLPLDAASLGATFKNFMATNRFAAPPLNFKPQPQIIRPQVTLKSVLPQASTWQLVGEIAVRKYLNPLTVPTLPFNDVIAPSRVQLLVDKTGEVVSAVLLETSGDTTADQQALALARKLQFAPADKLMFGEIIFNWQTVPLVSPP